MNHRELVLSARKKAKFHFLQLPESLQDEIIEKLDGQALTLEAARDFLAGRGHVLSHEAIASYYRAVRRERRIYDSTQELTRVFEEFQGQDLAGNLEALTNFLIAQATSRIADGEIGFRDIDLGKIVQSLASLAKRNAGTVQAQPAPRRDGEGSAGEAAGGGAHGADRRLDREALNKIREQVYGIF